MAVPMEWTGEPVSVTILVFTRKVICHLVVQRCEYPIERANNCADENSHMPKLGSHE